ncbi:MAG: TlpA family protein disulfide reductase [Thermoanaerobaculia bacterium]
MAEWHAAVPLFDARWNTRVQEIKRVERGATVTVFFGTWCHASRQEVPQFLKILDVLEGQTPFAFEFFGVDEEKQQPAAQVQSNQIWFLPTFIVSRNGREVGRIVEQPARTLEKDLLRLLNGTARGFLSSNEDAIVQHLTAPEYP